MAKRSNLWFHWSPSSRRKSIIRYGLVPGNNSIDNLWKPPYICLGESPKIAWLLSGNANGRNIKDWDLWEVWTHDNSFEEFYYDDHKTIREVRVYERIYKRNVWLVGHRSNK